MNYVYTFLGGMVAGGTVVYIYHSIIMGKVAAAQALAAGVKKAL